MAKWICEDCGKEEESYGETTYRLCASCDLEELADIVKKDAVAKLQKELTAVGMQRGAICEDTELKKQFGFVEGETKCAYCHKDLTTEAVHWAFGQWWHRMVKDCHR